MSWLRVFEHLLPRARAWYLTVQKQLRQFITGLAEALGPDAKLFVDEVFDDLFPQTTRQLTEWEQQFGLAPEDLTEQERRDRLSAEWQAQGGQDPRYIQDVLRAAGFDVYVHDFFEPRPLYTDPVVIRSPFTVIGAGTAAGTSCGEPLMQCGEEFAQCANYVEKDGYPLVNKTPALQVLPIPPALDTFPGWLYVGGPNFGDVASVPVAQRDDLERLVLKICPAHLWVGMIVSYS